MMGNFHLTFAVLSKHLNQGAITTTSKTTKTESETDSRKYNDDGMRLTDCCGCVSSFCDDTLCCKGCYKAVPHGQGDGLEYRSSPAPECI